MMIQVLVLLSVKGQFSNPAMTASSVFHAGASHVLPPHIQMDDEFFLLSLQEKHPA
jgi:hypothetical protein